MKLEQGNTRQNMRAEVEAQTKGQTEVWKQNAGAKKIRKLWVKQKSKFGQYERLGDSLQHESKGNNKETKSFQLMVEARF